MHELLGPQLGTDWSAYRTEVWITHSKSPKVTPWNGNVARYLNLLKQTDRLFNTKIQGFHPFSLIAIWNRNCQLATFLLRNLYQFVLQEKWSKKHSSDRGYIISHEFLCDVKCCSYQYWIAILVFCSLNY